MKKIMIDVDSRGEVMRISVIKGTKIYFLDRQEDITIRELIKQADKIADDAEIEDLFRGGSNV